MTATVSTASDPDRLNLDEIHGFLGRRWKLIAATALGCAVLALVVCLSLKPTYTATSQVLLDPHRQHVFGTDAVQPDGALDSSIVDSQISIITSTRLLAKVINKENLAADPEFAASAKPGLLSRILALFRAAKVKETEQPTLDGIDPKLAPVIINLFNKIDVVRIAKSYVLSLSVSSRDPAKATRLANSLAETFVEDRVDVHAKSVGQAAAFFEDRLGSLRDQVRTSERAVADFRKKHDLTTTTIDGKLTVSELQLQHLNEQLALAATDTAEKLARFQQATRFTIAGTNVDTLPEIVRSAVITALRGQQADLLRRESDLSAAYGPAYPAITQIRAQKAGLERAIAAEMRRLVTTLHNDYEVAAARESALRKTIGGLSNVSGGDNDVGVQLRELERTNMANQALFENFLNRAKLTQEQSSFEEPDARLISPALEPTAPSFPKTKLFVPIAGVAGLIFGLGLAALADLAKGEGGSSEGSAAADAQAFILGHVLQPGHRVETAEQIGHLLGSEPTSRFAEGVNALAAKLLEPVAAGQGRAVALAPLDKAKHATCLVMSLATVLGTQGRRVLLIDADSERRTLSRACDATKSVGFAEVLAQETSAMTAVVARPHFALLPAGAHAWDASKGRRLRNLLAEARQRFDLILLDGPALDGSDKELALREAIDGFAVVADWDGLRRGDFTAAIDDAADAPKFLGFVLTRDAEPESDAYALAS